MRKVLLLVAATSAFYMGAAQAISADFTAGEHFTELNGGFGTQGSGLALMVHGLVVIIMVN